MYQSPSKCFLVLNSILIFLVSQDALANKAIVHSFSQSPDSTQGVLTYSCWGYYCKLKIEKNGVVQLNANTPQGNYQVRTFDYGTGSFDLTVESYRQVYFSRGTPGSVLDKTSAITVFVYEGGSASAGSTQYTYDALGRLKSVEISGGRTTTYSYDDADNRTGKAVTD